MDIDAVGKWLTASIVGVIVLGVMVSVLGAIFVRIGKPLAKFILRRLAGRAARGGIIAALAFLFSLTWIVVTQRVVARRLNRLSDKSLSVAFCTSAMVSADIMFCSFAVFLTGSILFWGSCGLQHPLLLAFLVGATLLCFAGCAVGYAVAFSIRYESEIGKYERRIEGRLTSSRLLHRYLGRTLATAIRVSAGAHGTSARGKPEGQSTDVAGHHPLSNEKSGSGH
jgi:hypothetical protein